MENLKEKWYNVVMKKIPYYPLTQSGIDIITPEWEKNFKLVKSEFFKRMCEINSSGNVWIYYLFNRSL